MCLLFTAGAISQLIHSLLTHLLSQGLCANLETTDLTAGKHTGHKSAHRQGAGFVDTIGAPVENQPRDAHRISPVELAESMLHLVQSPYQASMQRTIASETCQTMLGTWREVHGDPP